MTDSILRCTRCGSGRLVPTGSDTDSVTLRCQRCGERIDAPKPKQETTHAH